MARHFEVFLTGLAVAVVSTSSVLAAWHVKSASGFSFVPRYGVIWEGKLTRSGMPEEEAGWRWLRARGVKTVVNFRRDDDVDYRKFGFEHSLWLPLGASEAPSEATVERFLKFVQDPANWPVHIHCAEGKTRTGMMAALVRYAVDGWPLKRALAEARSYRRGKDLSPSQLEFLGRWAAKHPPGSHRERESSALEKRNLLEVPHEKESGFDLRFHAHLPFRPEGGPGAKRRDSSGHGGG